MPGPSRKFTLDQITCVTLGAGGAGGVVAGAGAGSAAGAVDETALGGDTTSGAVGVPAC